MSDTRYLVVELGTRIACGACGLLLAEIGADVVFVEAEPARAGKGKFAYRENFAAGKRIASAETDLAELLARADAVLTSSDLDPPWISRLLAAAPGSVICDITAFGKDGPLAGKGFSDGLVQAMSGVIDTTGRADAPPHAVGAPVLEFSAALYAAAALVVSLGAPDREHIDIALYDCAVNALATFLPAHLGGGRPGRVGNRHSMATPWNAYPTADGWVLICATDDRQWRRICDVIGQPELWSNPDYATHHARMMRRDRVDSILETWCRRHSVGTVVRLLGNAGIACGPIVTVDHLFEDANIRHRGLIREQNGRRLPTALLHLTAEGGQAPSWRPLRRNLPSRVHLDGLPLAGIRVVEIGQYTTAPFAGRHLASLGAEVVKVEPPEGDTTRTWAPLRDGLSYFFVLSNTGKRSVTVDLRSREGAEWLRRELAQADVLIENMKPGSLAQLGFAPPELRRINPRLVYCSISGFGNDSAYPGRPAYDTVVQAMSGLMDLTRDGDMPLKAGISIADIFGGELALFGVLAALRCQGEAEPGLHLDLAMQDAAAWLTQLAWNEPNRPLVEIVACRDGYVAVEPGSGVSPAPDQDRVELVAALDSRGINAAPVLTVGEVAAHPQTAARNLIVETASAELGTWPAFGSPLHFSQPRTRIGEPLGVASSWNQ